MILPGHFSSITRSDNFVCPQRQLQQTHRRVIYPSELLLKTTTTTPSETSYLDTNMTDIGEGNRTVRISIYDKRLQLQDCELSVPGQHHTTESCVRRLHISTGEVCRNLQQKR